MCKSVVKNLELFVVLKEMSGESYLADAVTVLTIQNGITFLTSLTILVIRTQLARQKIKAPLKRVDRLRRVLFFFQYYTPDTIAI